MALALRIALWGSSALGVSSLLGGRKDDSLLDDLTPILAMSVTGFALWVIVDNR